MTLFLIPVPIGDSVFEYVQLSNLKYFIAENAKKARKALKIIIPGIDFKDIEIIEQDKHVDNFEEIKSWVKARKDQGQDFGLVSDAGVPCIADPGSRIVEYAHKLKIRIEPLVGPSSILLALMASGFNGQAFTFHGYLPIDEKEQAKKIKSLEDESLKRDITQIFIETPYRNYKLLENLQKNLSSSTKLCVACNLNSKAQEIVSQTIGDWKNIKIDLHKKPAVFLIYSR